jgi:hypothetical protein
MCFLPLYLKCRALKIGCVAITEHNNIDGGLRFKRFCEKRGNKVSVIVGEEVFTSEGEVIGLFLKENIPKGLSAKETIEIIKGQGGVVYVPHPYDEKRAKTVLAEKAISENKNLIDCIEVHNGRNISSAYDIKQKEIAEKFNLCHVVGADAHTLIEIGRNYLEVSSLPVSADEFRTVIKSARFHQSNCLKLSHIITKFAKAVKMLGKGNFDELHRTITKKIKRSKY